MRTVVIRLPSVQLLVRLTYFLCFLFYLEIFLYRETYVSLLKHFGTEVSFLAVNANTIVFLTTLGLCVIYGRVLALRILAFLLYHFLLMVHYKYFLYGADIYFGYILFSSIFLFLDGETEFSRFVRGISYYLLKFQMSYHYLTNGIFKLVDEYWQTGRGMYIFFKGSPVLMDVFIKYPFTTVVLSYGVIALEILGAMAIWTRMRRPAIYLFILFHIAIAIFLPLAFFASGVGIILLQLLIFDELIKRQDVM